MSELPGSARAVIVGGGVIGCSVAYHLAKRGWRDVLLLERRQLTCGTTWHAAGLIAQLRATQNMTRLARYSQELYWGLEQETGVATGFRRNGSITVALTAARREELLRSAAMARAFGVEIDEIDAAEVERRYPQLKVDDITAAVYLPKDGQGDPVNITQALAKGARQRGARLLEGVEVTDVLRDRGRATGVRWRRGDETGGVAADVVINCAGMWAREFGRRAGVSVPLHACEHFYIVTDAIPGLGRLPVLRVPDECAYYKEDAGRLLLGAFEPNAKPWATDGIPADFCFDQLAEDFDHFEPILARACKRLPLLADAGIQTFFNGPESFTPDDRYLLGPAPELDGYYVAAGFNSVGIQSAGGAGMALAAWIDDGDAPFDLSDVDIRRMQPFQSNRRYLYARVKETLGLLYADHFPYRQPVSARGVRRTPLHLRLAERGACFGELAGWERANWFAPPGIDAEYRYAWGRQNWFDYSAAEHRAVREAAGLFDLSSFGKLRVEGRDAEAVLQRVSANDIAVEPGRIVYTQWLNAAGGVEADLTVTRLDEHAFLVVTPAATLVRDRHWLCRHIPDDARCVVTDVTAAEAVLALMGPHARELLARITDADLSDTAFPFGTAQTLELAMGVGRAHRISYVGELGWELYVSADMALHVLDALLDAGGERLTLCGLHALDSCRLEKAFRHYGHDLTSEDHVLEAGLGFAVKTDKDGRLGDFIGRAAVLDKRRQGLSRRLLQFKLDDAAALLFHNEPILRDGRPVGYLCSGNYGHYLGAAVGLGYVPAEDGESAADQLAARYQIDVAGTRIGARVSLQPLYDPRGERRYG